MYRGFWLREAQSVGFYEVLTLGGDQVPPNLWYRVGPLKKDLTCVGGGEGELEVELGSYEFK